MLTFSNTAANGSSQTISQNTAYVTGNATGRFLFVATAQDLIPGTGGPLGSPAQEAQRTATTCYMRGLSEHVRIQTNSGLPWFHRRICFTTKGGLPFTVVAEDDTPVQAYAPYLDTINGMQRIWFNMTVNNMQSTINRIEGVLFKGASGVDWNDPILAPLDTSRVSVKFDHTWTIRSGNANGSLAERKLWHQMNHNLRYGDDESGVNEATSYLSTTSKIGMGDYYVMDYIGPGIGGTSSDLLNVYSNSTLYWHEK